MYISVQEVKEAVLTVCYWPVSGRTKMDVDFSRPHVYSWWTTALLLRDASALRFLGYIPNLKSMEPVRIFPQNHTAQTVPLLRCININIFPPWWKEWCFALINPLRSYPKPRLNDTFHSVPAVSLICLQDTIFSVLSQG